MLITRADVKDTVGRLYKAGKMFPQRDRANAVASGEERVKLIMSIMKDTIDTIADIFVPRRIGAERWKKATEIAILSSEKTISPALMATALKQAETEYVQQNITANEEAKRQAVSTYSSEDNKVLWEWTRRKLAEGRTFSDYMPDDNTVSNYGRKIGLTDTEIMKQKSILKAYLCDAKFAAVNKCPIGSKLFVHQADDGKMVKLALI